MNPSIQKLQGSRRGQVTVMFAASLMTLLGMVTLTVDVGFFYSVKAQLQAAADVALMSAIGQLPPQASFEEQNQILQETVTQFQKVNFGPQGVMGLVPASEPAEPWKIMQVTAYMDPATHSMVRAEVNGKYNLPTAFARLFGLNTVDIGIFSSAEVLHVNRHGQNLLIPRLLE